MSELPLAPGDISAQWLSSVLATEISSVTLVDAHAGTTGRAVIEIEHDRNDLPKRLFVKLPPTDETQRQFVTSTGMGKREVQFYQHLSAEVPVRVPHCYYAQSDEAGAHYIMLLEHLEDTHCTFRNASTRYSKEYVRLMLAAFARLHAQYWDTPRFETDLSWVTPPAQHEIAIPLVELALQKHTATMPAVFREMGELYIEHADAIHQLWDRGTPTLIHGDVHDGNFFSDGQEPGFLDWAIVSRGPGLRDIGYFLAGTLQSEDQLNWGREMLRYYREQLLAAGVKAPTEKELWEQYQCHAAYVWIASAVTLAMGDEWQETGYVLAGLERIHNALEHLGSVAAIRAAL